MSEKEQIEVKPNFNEILIDNATTDTSLNTKENIQNQPEDITNDYPASIFTRCFKKMLPGSLRGSIFNLSIVSLGVGCLTLPKVFADLGVTFSIIMLILLGLVAVWTLYMLTYAGRKSGLSVYSQVCEHFLGKKAAVVLDISNIILLFGLLTIYQIIRK